MKSRFNRLYLLRHRYLALLIVKRHISSATMYYTRLVWLQRHKMTAIVSAAVAIYSTIWVDYAFKFQFKLLIMFCVSVQCTGIATAATLK
jgi:hypothetical protein